MTECFIYYCNSLFICSNNWSLQELLDQFHNMHREKNFDSNTWNFEAYGYKKIVSLIIDNLVAFLKITLSEQWHVSIKEKQRLILLPVSKHTTFIMH